MSDENRKTWQNEVVGYRINIDKVPDDAPAYEEGYRYKYQVGEILQLDEDSIAIGISCGAPVREKEEVRDQIKTKLDLFFDIGDPLPHPKNIEFEDKTGEFDVENFSFLSTLDRFSGG